MTFQKYAVLVTVCIFYSCWHIDLFAQSGAKNIIVVDDVGRTVELVGAAQRIISLAPHITENLFSVGAGDQLVGVVDYSDFPIEAKNIQSVGTYKNINLEVIASLQPDLIVGWASGNGIGKLQQLIDLGFNVYISEPRTLASIADSLERYAVLTANQSKGLEVSQRYRKALLDLRENQKSKKRLSVFYQIWNEPLQTLNSKHIISDVIHLCGGRNSFGDSPVIAPRIGVESVLELDPEVIIASGMDDSRPPWLDEWLRWPNLQAVKRNNLYFITPDHLQRHTIRILLGAKKMCYQLDLAREKLY